MTDIANKVVVVTGAGSGLGQALAVESALKGAKHIVAIDIDPSGLEETVGLVEQSNVPITTYTADIASKEAVYDIAQQVDEQLGGADIVINNAGVSLVCPTADASYEDLEWVMNINYWGVVYGCKAFLPQLKAKGSGHIANVSSVMGVFTTSLSSAYSSSKFAVRGFTESLRQELRNSGVGVSCVHPGGIKTNVMYNSRYDNELSEEQKQKASEIFSKVPGLSSTEAARRLLRGIEKNKKRIMVGADARFIDLITRLLPSHYDSLLGSLVEKQMNKMRQV